MTARRSEAATAFIQGMRKRGRKPRWSEDLNGSLPERVHMNRMKNVALDLMHQGKRAKKR
jgi:hypothetical protein